ncbi:MAG: hypothetical protein ABIP45_02765 [Knoellia sp.]
MEGRDDQEGQPEQDDEGDEPPQPTATTRVLLVAGSCEGAAAARGAVTRRIRLTWGRLALRVPLTDWALSGSLTAGRALS